MILFGCAFLLMGTLDALHTFSYKGMVDFFIVNDSSNRATTLWILSRFLGTLGFMAATVIPKHIKSTIKKEFFSVITIIFTLILVLCQLKGQI